MEKCKANTIEIMMIFIIATATIITTPPVFLLAIPFSLILILRTIFSIIIEDEEEK